MHLSPSAREIKQETLYASVRSNNNMTAACVSSEGLSLGSYEGPSLETSKFCLYFLGTLYSCNLIILSMQLVKTVLFRHAYI